METILRMAPNALAQFTPEEIGEAIHMSWQYGVLNYRRRNTQKHLKIQTEYIKQRSRKVYWECTRRLGKSSELLATFTEHCLQRPGWRAGFFAPVKDGLQDYIEPVIDETLRDCPNDVRPHFNTQRMMLEFKNGSVIVFRGSNNKQHRVRRGQEFHEAGVDEGRDVDELDVLIDSVLMPSLFDKEGFLYISSTPADSRSHPLYRYRQQAEAGKWLVRLTIWDANKLDPFVYPIQRIREWQNETLQSVDGDDKWKREYECEWVVNKSRAAVPEWSGKFILDLPKDPYYQFYHHYVSIDWGYKDFTAIGFATYHFRQARLSQEAELAFSGTEVRSDRISAAIYAQATKLWGPSPNINKMVSDSADPILINELNQHPGMSFVPVHKENSLEAMLQQFRCLVAAGKIIVSPKCPLTLHGLGNGIWDDHRKKLDQDVFARHFDHLMQLVYMTRIVDMVTNPIPADFMMDGIRVIDLDFDKKDKRKSQAAKGLEEAFLGAQRRF